MYFICITWKFKSRQKDENRVTVVEIVYLGPHLDLQMLDPFTDTSRDFVVIMIRLIRQTIQTNGAPHRTTRYWGGIPVALCRHIIENPYSCQQMNHCFCRCLRLCFRARILLFLQILWRRRVSLLVFWSLPTGRASRTAFRTLITRYFLTPGVWLVWRRFPTVVKPQYSTPTFFGTTEILYFLSSVAVFN